MACRKEPKVKKTKKKKAKKADTAGATSVNLARAA